MLVSLALKERQRFYVYTHALTCLLIQLRYFLHLRADIQYFQHVFSVPKDFSLTGLPMTPSVHLNSEADSDHQKEPIAFSRELFTNDNGKFSYLY